MICSVSDYIFMHSEAHFYFFLFVYTNCGFIPGCRRKLWLSFAYGLFGRVEKDKKKNIVAAAF